jgi:hypothetical protein
MSPSSFFRGELFLENTNPQQLTLCSVTELLAVKEMVLGAIGNIKKFI